MRLQMEQLLPAGLLLNNSAANGLEACSEGETQGYTQEGRHIQGGVGFTGSAEFDQQAEPGTRTDTFTEKLPEPLQPGTNFCPNASKVGTVHIKTPDLARRLLPDGQLHGLEAALRDDESQGLVRRDEVGEQHGIGVEQRLHLRERKRGNADEGGGLRVGELELGEQRLVVALPARELPA